MLEHHFADLPSGRIHYVEQGSGPAVVLLHGFPEFWFSWRMQLPVLAASGFRAIAPDLRGYNLSHKPRDLDAYRARDIAEETAAFIREVAGGEKILLVGHDWGAVIAWLIAARHPELLRRLVIINIPHPSVVRRAAFRPAQVIRFWYQFAFQPPVLPELLLRARRFALLVRAMKSLLVDPRLMTGSVAETYRAAWAQPGALTGMLAWYRALFRRGRRSGRGESSRVAVPTLLIHGLHDRIFLPELFEESRAMVGDLTIERIAAAGHLAHQDQPELINRLILREARA